MPITLNEWFCMREGRSSFLPRLPVDARLVFCHKDLIDDDIITSIEKRFATKKPIKMLIHGDWGVGKTHLVYHICWWLDQHKDDYPAYPVVIEIGDIAKKSRFDEIVRPLLDELGLDFLIKLVHQYRGQEPNVANTLRAKGIASHVAEAFNKILLSSPGQPPVDMVSQTFEYLKGRKVPGAANIGLGQPIDQSQDFVDILTAVGEMYQTVNGGTRILFIADEATKLESVEGDEATQNHWMTANKLIFDDRNQSFGFIYTVSGKQASQLPQAVWDPQIQNRLGQNVFRLDTLKTPDVKTYLSNLLNDFLDWETIESLVASKEISPELYDRKTYPLTSDAMSRFVEYFDRAQENSKPRDISERLDDLAFLAIKRKQRVITNELLDAKDM